ncbi:MAG: tyrosine-type recombinase/integrase [Candidatus Komeilibacteria bacterium]|nr:tyrosine-type recombinase/integrase [Candidatus Komeilibacteria bacterium]
MKSQEPIKKYVIPFLDYCEVEKGLSNNTQRNYSQYLNLFVRWLNQAKKDNLLPCQLTPKDVWDYRLFLARAYKTSRNAHLAKKSQNYYLIALRALLDYFAEKDIACLPSSKVKLAKDRNENQVSFLELREVEKILMIPDTSTIIGLRDRAILETLFSTGMRISELVSLDKEQIAFLLEKDAIRTVELSIIGKGRRVRTIYISPRASAWIKKYLTARANEFAKSLFVNVRSKNPEAKRLTPRSIQIMISKYAKRAGLAKKVTPHTLRHTYATDLLSHGADLRSVQEFLGHKSVATTQVYTHVTNKRLKDIHERFHGGNDMSDK